MSGGILVCAEVHFYMNLRLFRIDAGGIHIYACAAADAALSGAIVSRDGRSGFLAGTADAALAAVLSSLQHGPGSHD